MQNPEETNETIKPPLKKGENEETEDMNETMKPQLRKGENDQTEDMNETIKPRLKKGENDQTEDTNETIKPQLKKGENEETEDMNETIKPQLKKGENEEPENKDKEVNESTETEKAPVENEKPKEETVKITEPLKPEKKAEVVPIVLKLHTKNEKFNQLFETEMTYEIHPEPVLEAAKIIDSAVVEAASKMSAMGPPKPPRLIGSVVLEGNQVEVLNQYKQQGAIPKNIKAKQGKMGMNSGKGKKLDNSTFTEKIKNKTLSSVTLDDDIILDADLPVVGKETYSSSSKNREAFVQHDWRGGWSDNWKEDWTIRYKRDIELSREYERMEAVPDTQKKGKSRFSIKKITCCCGLFQSGDGAPYSATTSTFVYTSGTASTSAEASACAEASASAAASTSAGAESINRPEHKKQRKDESKMRD